MGIATFEGFVENGKILLTDGIQLPDHAKVYVIVPDSEIGRIQIASPRLVHQEQARDFEKEVIEAHSDASL
ncbi:MAG: hypothetical protein AB1512_22725 [Thermodesulfobacteriota bacterium]